MNTNNQYEITFETKCYENDWEYVLKTNYLNRMIQNCNFEFGFKQVIINNITQQDIVEYYAQKKIKEKIIDAYYFVDDYIEETLKFFDITKESFNGGYYYSSAELVGLYMTKSKYLLHFSSDSFLPKKDKSFWIKEACNIFEKNPNIVVANPAWSYQFNEAKKEAQGNSTGNFYLGYGFSDQCYLVRTIDFRARIYNFRHPYSERYPKYGGELFEKRVDSYMRMHNKQRITSVKESYIHSNFPHKGLSKIAVQFLLKINVYFFVHEIKRRNRIVRKLESLYRIGKRCIKRLVKGRHGV